MNRRETIKSLLLGSVAAGIALNGCAPDPSTPADESHQPAGDSALYGRTVKEKERDQKLFAETFFNEHELATMAVLCDIILPKNDNFGSATDAGVPEFIEFIVKDMPYQQTPLRGGLMWLDTTSNRWFGANFKDATDTQQLELCDKIAYPGKTEDALLQGEQFFTRMRNLTLTGYYTSKMGIDDLGYKGNMPNVWDGVPQEVLDKHGLQYDQDWLAKCVDQSKRDIVAEWDDDGNLVT